MLYLWFNNDIFVVGDLVMNVYDFDKTIYDGDSSIDFYLYCLSKNKKCLLIIPSFFFALILYKLKLRNKEYLKSKFFRFVIYFDNIEAEARNFWKNKNFILKDFYLKKHENSDIIISASPEFLLKPMCEHHSFELIATKIDLSTGKLIGKNCHGQEKVERLFNERKMDKINEFYSDSSTDIPLAKIANMAYLVKGNEIIKWDIISK